MSETEAKKAKVKEPTPKDVSKSRTDNPLPKTPNIVQALELTTSTSTILVDPELKLMLGRMDHRWVLHDLIVNINNQDNLATRTYDIMASLIRVDFPMTRAQFITIWKTLLYKRVQDVYTREKGPFCGFGRKLGSMWTPAPLQVFQISVINHGLI